MPSEVPVLDLTRLKSAVASQRQEFLDQLLAATQGPGVFQLMGHGIPQTLADVLIAVARRFFALPEADRLAIENVKSPQFRGYARLGQEMTAGQPDWHEQFDVGVERPAPVLGSDDPTYTRLDGPNQWPAALPELQEVVEGWMTASAEVAAQVLGALAITLGQPETYFDHEFSDRPRMLTKINRYPGRDAETAEGEGVGAHRDHGYLTLVLQDDVGGLQFATESRGFVDVPALPHSLIVNIGQMLEFASRGVLHAPVHRVRSPAVGTDRISVAFFYNPQLDTVVREIPLPEDLSAVAPVPSDADHPASVDYGLHMLNGWLGAHPGVAARHYGSRR